MRAVQVEIPDIAVCIVDLIALGVLRFPISTLEFLVHVHYLINSLSFLVILGVVPIELTECLKCGGCAVDSLLAEFQNREMSNSEQLQVLVLSVGEVHANVLKIYLSMMEKHTDGLCLAEAVVIVQAGLVTRGSHKRCS